MLTEAIVARMSPGQLCQHFLLASYAYYIEAQSPMTDGAFDLLCKRLAAAHGALTHPHKHLIDADALAAGSGYYLARDDYPTLVTHGVYDYIRKCESGEMARLLEPHLAPVARRIGRTVAPRTVPAAPVVAPASAPRRVGRTIPAAVAAVPTKKRFTRTTR